MAIRKSKIKTASTARAGAVARKTAAKKSAPKKTAVKKSSSKETASKRTTPIKAVRDAEKALAACSKVITSAEKALVRAKHLEEKAKLRLSAARAKLARSVAPKHKTGLKPLAALKVVAAA